jgi:putative membrane protein
MLNNDPTWGSQSMTDQVQKQVPLSDATRLALERTNAAYDRTLMAWMRTAISLITFGFAIYKFFQIELDRGARQNTHLIGAREFSLIMVCAGLLAMALGLVDHWLNTRPLRARDPTLPHTRTFAFSTVVFTLGLLALLAVIFRQ